MSLGDLAIDPKGREWRRAYAGSRELEKIRELAETNAFRDYQDLDKVYRS